jgi:UDP-N-acetylglucosamine 2-epimerase (non-hydrolysing)
MILFTYGTRPEWIKIKPLIEEMDKNNMPFKILFTGQHKDIIHKYADYNMIMVDRCENRLNSVVINCLEIPDEYFNGITYVLVHGDTTSALSLALNAFNRKIKIIHLESGLRTNDFENPYPEEANRQLISRISDINLCPTTLNSKNLMSEGIPSYKNFVVGNTGLDNLLKYKNVTTYEDIVLVTLHRRENHDNIEKWFKVINELADEHKNIKFILPIHPNPEVKKHKNILTNVEVVDPLSHDDLLNILIKSKLVITDSGGLQEECSFFDKKCLVCRKITERPESVGLSSFMVQSSDNLKQIFNDHIKNYQINITSPYGDGKSSKKICDIFKKLYN